MPAAVCRQIFLLHYPEAIPRLLMFHAYGKRDMYQMNTRENSKLQNLEKIELLQKI